MYRAPIASKREYRPIGEIQVKSLTFEAPPYQRTTPRPKTKNTIIFPKTSSLDEVSFDKVNLDELIGQIKEQIKGEILK